jgi:hypothetical protein
VDASGFFSDLSPLLIPLAGILMPVLIVGIVFWYKGREKELQAHMDLRLREMEHQQKMKQLELEIEKAKAARSDEPAGKIGA